MKKGLLLLLLASLPALLSAQGSLPRITLITGSPGEDLYSVFGHTAIRVQDTLRGRDLTYSYGVFDFDTPNFYLKFIRGKLNYKLGLQSYKSLLREYGASGRRLTEQEILLDDSDKTRLLRFLQENYKPENRYYLYDFFYDNCATRVRDALEATCGTEALSYPPAEPVDSLPTFRDFLHEYLARHDWTRFGIDLLLGRPTDKRMDFREQMFLPDYLASHLAQVRYRGGPLLGPEQEIIPLELELSRTPLPLRPVYIFGLLALVILAISWLRPGLWPAWLDTTLGMLAGLAGIFLLLMWFGTDHGAVKHNWNLLFLNPLALLWAFLISRKGKIAQPLGYLLAAMAFTAGILAPLLPQAIHPAAALLAIGLGIRFLQLSVNRKRQ